MTICLQLNNHDTIQNEISKDASEKMVSMDGGQPVSPAPAGCRAQRR
jgi:hypothetical protein